MNKRNYKKEHPDFMSRRVFRYYVNWLNLYKRQLRMLREQKQGKHSKLLIILNLSKLYIEWHKTKI